MSSKFFSTMFISSEHCSTFLILSKLFITHLSSCARQQAFTVREKSLAHKSRCAQKAFAHRSFAFTPTSFYTQRSFYTQQAFTHTEAFTYSKLLHTEKRLHTEKLVHIEALTQSKLLQGEAFTHSKRLHTESFYTECFYTWQAFTRSNLLH